MRILVCGSRDFSDYGLLSHVMDQHTEGVEEVTIIHGCAMGADYLADEWARSNDLDVISVPAEWSLYGKKAGYLRNKKMLEMNPDKVIAFFSSPDSKGTLMMCSLAEDKGVPVLRYGAI